MGTKIVLCNCGGERISQERLQKIENDLVASGVDIIKISDLCRMAALQKERLCEVFNKSGEYLVIGCYSRTMKLLIDQAEPAISHDKIEFVNFLESTDQEIYDTVAAWASAEVAQAEPASITPASAEAATASSSGQSAPPAPPAIHPGPVVEVTMPPSDWPSWFPVIDYSRCTACGQCADFCLFGVYEKTPERVTVTNPQGCKYNCPACARICPQTAIIFPKYKPGGAIGGSEFIDEISEQKRQVNDINSILGGDIYQALEKRKMRRRSIIMEEAMNKAIEERSKALKNQNI